MIELATPSVLSPNYEADRAKSLRVVDLDKKE